jgi:hypothetical protein
MASIIAITAKTIGKNGTQNNASEAIPKIIAVTAFPFDGGGPYPPGGW